MPGTKLVGGVGVQSEKSLISVFSNQADKCGQRVKLMKVILKRVLTIIHFVPYQASFSNPRGPKYGLPVLCIWSTQCHSQDRQGRFLLRRIDDSHSICEQPNITQNSWSGIRAHSRYYIHRLWR